MRDRWLRCEQGRERVGPVCYTPLLGDCDFNEIRCGGERQRRRIARWSGAYTEVLCGLGGSAGSWWGCGGRLAGHTGALGS